MKRRKKSNILAVAISVTIYCSGCSNDNPVASRQNLQSKPKPTASFTADVLEAVAPKTIKFTNTSTNAEAFKWDFGNGKASVDKDPTNLYDKPGDFTITLQAIGGGGVDSASIKIRILAPAAETLPGAGAAKIKIGDIVGTLMSVHGSSAMVFHTFLFGLHMWTFQYSAKGLKFYSEVVNSSIPGATYSSMTKISSIQLAAPYSGVTEKNIGIGSSQAEAEAAYGSANGIPGIKFTYTSGKVTMIYIPS